MNPADQLRPPFLVVALMCIVAAVALEAGSTFFLTANVSGAAATTRHQLGIPTLWLLDISLAWTVLVATLPLVLDKNLVARTQGVATLILSIVVIFAGIAKLIEAFVLLMVMLALIGSLLGFFVYLAIFGKFDTGAAANILGTITFFKLGLAVFLLLAQQSFFKSKGLVILIVFSLVCDLLLNLLHGLVPGPFVSITDAVGAIIVAIVAIVWAIFAAVWALVAIVRALVAKGGDTRLTAPGPR